MAIDKRKTADGGGPTESSLPNTTPEPGDAADRAQQDDPNNYTPGNETNSEVKKQINEGKENVA